MIRLAPDGLQAKLIETIVRAFDGSTIPFFPEELRQVLAEHDDFYHDLIAIRSGNVQVQTETVTALAAMTKDTNSAKKQIQLIAALGDVSRKLPAQTQRRFVEHLLGNLQNSTSDSIKIASLATLQKFEQVNIAEAIVEQFSKVNADVKVVAVSTLASRAAWSKRLLSAVDQDKIKTSEINVDALARMRMHQDPELQTALEQLFPETRATNSFDKINEQINAMNELLKGDLGNAIAGKALFESTTVQCSKCHKMFGQGGDIGPELTDFDRRRAVNLLQSVMYPDVEIREGYETWNVRTIDGQLISGFKVNENDQILSLREASGQTKLIPQEDIDEIQKSRRSLMPAGLLDGLTDQQLRDLFAYLSSTSPPK